MRASLKQEIEKYIQESFASKELESHERLLNEVREQRSFLTTQFKGLVWIVSIALIAVGFIIGYAVPSKIDQAVDEKVIEYEIVESFRDQLDFRLGKAADKAIIKAEGEILERADGIIRKSIDEVILTKIINTIDTLDISSETKNSLKGLVLIQKDIRELQKEVTELKKIYTSPFSDWLVLDSGNIAAFEKFDSLGFLWPRKYSIEDIITPEQIK